MSSLPARCTRNGSSLAIPVLHFLHFLYHRHVRQASAKYPELFQRAIPTVKTTAPSCRSLTLIRLRNGISSALVLAIPTLMTRSSTSKASTIRPVGAATNSSTLRATGTWSIPRATTATTSSTILIAATNATSLRAPSISSSSRLLTDSPLSSTSSTFVPSP